MGWTPTAPAGAGRPGTSRVEVERDRRSGQRSGSGRSALQRAVHTAAAGACGESEFFEQLAARRVAVRLRTDAAGRVCGYAVARTTKGRPSGPWISGSRLRCDLSLPRLRARWNAADSPACAGDTGLEVVPRDCEPELAPWLHRHSGPDPAGWCAAASAVADLTIAVAGWSRSASGRPRPGRGRATCPPHAAPRWPGAAAGPHGHAGPGRRCAARTGAAGRRRGHDRGPDHPAGRCGARVPDACRRAAARAARTPDHHGGGRTARRRARPGRHDGTSAGCLTGRRPRSVRHLVPRAAPPPAPHRRSGRQR